MMRKIIYKNTHRLGEGVDEFMLSDGLQAAGVCVCVSVRARARVCVCARACARAHVCYRSVRDNGGESRLKLLLRIKLDLIPNKLQAIL